MSLSEFGCLLSSAAKLVLDLGIEPSSQCTARVALLDLLCVLVMIHIIHIQDRITLEAIATRARAHMHMHMTIHL